MEEVVKSISTNISELYKSLISALPEFAQGVINLFFLVLLVFIYAVIVWKFYKFIAAKNILGLNLNKYNKSERPFFAKLLAGALYFVEYLVILPFIIFFWFSLFTIFLIFLTENLEISSLLIISAVVIATIRMTSYYNEELSKELAKLLPFGLLAFSLLNPNFFSIERVLNHLNQIPIFFNKTMSYLIFIITLEAVMRFFDFIFSLFGLEENSNTNKD